MPLVGGVLRGTPLCGCGVYLAFLAFLGYLSRGLAPSCGFLVSLFSLSNACRALTHAPACHACPCTAVHHGQDAFDGSVVELAEAGIAKLLATSL